MSPPSRPLAIVTGAAGGIGREIVEALVRANYNVAAWDKDVQGLSERTNSLNAIRRQVLAQQCDVSSEADVERAVTAAVEAFGAPYLLVNNAATRNEIPLENLPRDVWDRELSVNLSGMFQCTQSVGRHMLVEGRGVIVNISSVTATFGQPMRGAYSPSKAGILGLTNTTAVEWGPRGIRCNAISPGMIATPVHNKMYLNPALKKRREECVPLGRAGDGSDIADVVVFLASDAARYITGVNLPVDGGLSTAMISMLPTASTGDSGLIVTPLQLIQEKAAAASVAAKSANEHDRAHG